MNSFQKDIFSIIKSGLTGSFEPVSSDFDVKKAFEFSLSQCISVIFYQGIVNSKISVPEKLLEEIKKITVAQTVVSKYQENEIKRLYNIFEKNNIDFMPLKGAILKLIYPNAAMRYMGDMDILIKEEQYREIKKLLQKDGYKFVLESNHEFIWTKSDIIKIELHKLLVPSYDKDYFNYYGIGWGVAKKTDSTKHIMTDEDFLIYLIVHLAKHYRFAGVGIKNFIDILIFEKKKVLDFEYIKNELEKLKLYDFYCNVKKSIDVWFFGGTDNKITDIITDCVFESGVYGREKIKFLSSELKNGNEIKPNRFKVWKKIIFMPYKDMCNKYSILRKLPFLLPFLWIYRVVNVVFCKRDNILRANTSINSIGSEDIKLYKESLNEVGLNFDF